MVLILVASQMRIVGDFLFKIEILDKFKLNIFISHVDINKSFDNEDQVVIPVVQVY